MDPLSRGREVAGGVLRSSPKPEKKQQFFAIGEGSRFFVACFVHGSSQMCLYKTPGRRPPFITGRFVNAVTRGGSEPLTSAPRSDFMAQSLALSIDVCQGLGMPPLRINIWLSFSKADLGATSAQDCFFRLDFFFVFIASVTAILWRLSLEFVFFFDNIAFPLSSVLEKLSVFWGRAVHVFSSFFKIIFLSFFVMFFLLLHLLILLLLPVYLLLYYDC